MTTLLARRLASAVLAPLAAVSFAQAAPEAGIDGGSQHRAPQALVKEAGPGGPFGFYGPDLYIGQAAAQRFTVPEEADYRLVRIGLWLMNNSDTEHRALSLSVQTDALDEGGIDTMPSGHVLESWQTNVETLGWVPQEQFARSVRAPRLHAGRNYWIVAASRAPAGHDPVWVYAKHGNEVTTQSAGRIWYPGASGAALTLRVDAVPVAH